MNTMGISTDPTLLDVELPATLIESPSVSTFLPEEEASICPLLSTTNGTSTPMTFSHPLTPCVDNDSNTSVNLCNEDAKVETSSSSGSSSGIGMDAPDTAATSLFNKHVYQHLQINNGAVQESNGHNGNGNFTLSKNSPSFVSWNWPLIRKCTFFIFMSSLLAMCAIVVAMIVTLPKTCNPKTAWYRGSVFYEVFPASFQDSNNDGMGDLRGISNRVDYIASLGVSSVRLNSIFPSKLYPDDYLNVTSLTSVADVLGDINDLRQLIEVLHARNISLILDFPVNTYLEDKTHQLLPLPDVVDTAVVGTVPMNASTNEAARLAREVQPGDDSPTAAIRQWSALGVDGFYLKGLLSFDHHNTLLAHLAEWKRIIGPSKVLIISESVINALEEFEKIAALSHVDLVDVHLDVLNGTKQMEQRIKSVLSGPLQPNDNGVWIHWSIGGVDKRRITHDNYSGNTTLAATIMQLMLPGTPSIFYGDEIALEAVADPRNEHNETQHLHHLATMQWPSDEQQFTGRSALPWLPKMASCNFDHSDVVTRMIFLRDRSPSIYKNSICKMETGVLPNTEIRRSHDDILVVERVYPRRNSFVSISNFGHKRVKIDMTSMYYSGTEMLSAQDKEKIYFSDFQIGPFESIVVKLDK